MLDAADDTLEVHRTLCGLLLNFAYRFGIAGLLALEGTSAVRVAQLHSARLRGGEGILGALADQARFKFGHRSHLCQEEAPHRARRHVGEVTEYKVNVARH